MNNKNLKRFLVLLILNIILLSVQYKADAQRELPCREPKISNQALQKLIDNRKKRSQQKQPAASNKQVRVYFHICRDDNGSSAAATETEVLAEFAAMQADYAAGGICFIYAGVSFTNSTLLNHINLDTQSDADDLFEAKTIPGCLNIFYTDEIRGTNGASGGGIGGYAFNIPGTFCIVAKGNLGGHTSSHEAGHCLGLFHTFSDKGFGKETISGSNCSVAGDLICDTHADPYSFKSDDNDCFSENNGNYTGTCEDPEGHTNYSPPYTNIMSYWHRTPETFTSEQLNAMFSTIESDGDIAALASIDNLTLLTQSNNFGFIYKSALYSLTTVGNVEFTNVVQAGLFSKTIKLTPGFHAAPSLSFVLIRAAECNASFSFNNNQLPIADNSTKQQAVDTFDQTSYKIFPNPSTGIFTVQYNSKAKFMASIVVRNVMGQIVYRSASKEYFNNLQERINISGKPKGIYLVEITSGDKRMVTKILIE